MKCPKCQFEQADNGAECSKCGIIFSKWKSTSDITPTENQHNKSSAGFLTIALLFLGASVVVGAIYFSSGNTPATNKVETVATQPTEQPVKPEDNPLEEIQRKPPTPIQKKILEEENKTLSEQCKRGIVEMGGTEEDIKAHCS